MNVLYISYWNLDDPLTSSTVFPSLEILRGFDKINEIILVNIQRGISFIQIPGQLRIKYHPYNSDVNASYLWQKISDFVQAPSHIRKLQKQYNIRFVIARGAPAGALAYLCWRKNRVEFMVESFEPHAGYMLESSVWKIYDPRYIIESFFERKQKKYAKVLSPVAMNYKKELIREGIDPDKIKVAPCVVDKKKFAFNENSRFKIRKELGIDEDGIVGIYLGKYGGLYFKDQVFEIYSAAFSFFKEKLHLLLITPNSFHLWLNQQIEQHNLPKERIFVREVSHTEVAEYLSASDFALATYIGGRRKAFLSPVKVGEYWASGLPVLLTNGIGDETGILKQYPFAGVLFDYSSINEYWRYVFECLSKIIPKMDDREEIAKLVGFRDASQLKLAYSYFLGL